MLFLSCEQEENSNGITLENIEIKIEEAYIEEQANDNVTPLISVLFFIDKHNLKFNDACLSAKVMHLRAGKEIYLRDYNKVLSLSQKSFSLAEKCDDDKLKSLICNFLGIYYGRKNVPEKAIEYYKKSISFAEKLEERGFVIDTYYNICLISLEVKNWHEVIKNAENGIKAIEKSKTKISRLKYFYTYLARAQSHINQFEKAEENLENALKKTNSISPKSNVEYSKPYREVYLAYAFLYAKKKKYNLAFKYSRKADSMLAIKHLVKTKSVNNIIAKETELEDQLLTSKKELITEQKKIILGFVLFLLVVLFFLYKIIKLSKRLKVTLIKKEELFSDLKSSLKETKEVNLRLSKKNEKIESLLKFNKETLFLKTLKISTYKDAINNIVNNNLKIINKEEKIPSSKLLFINRSLREVISEEEIWEDFKIQFEKTRPNFFEKILEKCPDLSVTEQKHCAYIAINLKSKEVASILSLSPRSVETTRYRIKKKLNLKEDTIKGFLKKIG